MLADPAARTRRACRPAPDGSSSIGDGTSVLVLDDLDAAPAGKTYQAWVVTGQTPVSAGIFGSGGARPSSRSPGPCRPAPWSR